MLLVTSLCTPARLLTAVVIGALGGYYLAFTQTDFGLAYASGLVMLATAWLITTGMAYLAITRGLIQLHREWMIRSAVVTMAFVFFRLGDELGPLVGAVDVLEVPVVDGVVGLAFGQSTGGCVSADHGEHLNAQQVRCQADLAVDGGAVAW